MYLSADNREAKTVRPQLNDLLVGDSVLEKQRHEFVLYEKCHAFNTRILHAVYVTCEGFIMNIEILYCSSIGYREEENVFNFRNQCRRKATLRMNYPPSANPMGGEASHSPLPSPFISPHFIEGNVQQL